MESKPTFVMAPVETYTPADSIHETVREDYANENLLGAVVVGGNIHADCFVPYECKKAKVTYEVNEEY